MKFLGADTKKIIYICIFVSHYSENMKYFILYLKGIVIGIANVIPGVSGGTMAFIMNIYHQLTESIGNFVQNKEKRLGYFIFLLIIAVGAITGIIIFAKLFSFLLKNELYKQLTYFFFIGLIVGSVPFILSLEKDMKINLKRIIAIITAFALIFSTTFFATENAAAANTETTGEFLSVIKLSSIDFGYALWLFICGFLAAGSMVLPGFSGSALLISLGEYSNILFYVDERVIIPIAVVAAGAVPGIVIFAKVINIALKRFPSETIYFILGLIIASLYQIYLEMQAAFFYGFGALAYSAAAAAAGFAASFLLSRVKK